VNFLKKKIKLTKVIWQYESDLWQAFRGGDVWIAYAWPNDWVQMRKKFPVVYMHPREKPVAWVGMFMLLKGTPRPHLAHAYVDAWSSKHSGKWLEDNYGYGHANTQARPSSSQLLKALQLTNPRAVTLPNAHLDHDIPQRPLYAHLWEQVKASG
jgi:spermidine/putrescine transport system substrate-binding protein